jgi:hypothetical protein
MDTVLRERLMMVIAMVGSDHDGEFVNAARAADKLLRQRKLTWQDVMSPDGHFHIGDDRVVRLKLNLEHETNKALPWLRSERRQPVFNRIIPKARCLSGRHPR